jgi:ABC-type nitrate/sulfonate/bicarbonate transport system ATPase subunit
VGQVSLRRLQKSQGKGNVDQAINLIVRDDGRLVFMEASGCGKSTTLGTPTPMDSLPKHLSLDAVWPLGFDADLRLAA